MSWMRNVYQAFINNGLSVNQAKALTAEVGRENDFQPQYLFGRHVDEANGKINLGMISWQGSRAAGLDSRLKKKGLISKGSIVPSQAALNEMASYLVNEIKTNKRFAKTKRLFLDNPNVDYRTAENVLGRNFIAWDYDGSAVLGKQVSKHHAKRDNYYKQLGGIVSTQGAGPMSLTNTQKVKLYRAYKDGKMNAVQKAQYESDVKAGVVSMPKGGKIKSSPQPSAKKGEELPLSVVMAYNDGKLNQLQQAELEADVKAGIAKIPTGFKLQKPKPKGFIGRSGDKIKAAAQQGIDNVFDNGGLANIGGTADAALAVGGGMLDMAMQGMAGIGGIGRAAVNGNSIVEGYNNGVSNYDNTTPSRILKSAATPRTNTGGKILDVLGIVDDAIVIAGDAAYDTTGSPVVGAGTQTALNALGMISPLKGKKGRAASHDESVRRAGDNSVLRPDANDAVVRAARSSDDGLIGGVNRAQIDAPPRQLTPLEIYQQATARTTGSIDNVRANLDGLDSQSLNTSRAINNINTRPRIIDTNSAASPAPRIDIDAPSSSVVPIDHLLNLDESRPQTGGVPIDVQGLRAQVLKDLGLPDEKVRKGAVTGDITQLETEKSLSKLDTEAGRDMRAQLDDEYKTMNDYAQSIIEDDIGARAGASPESRGQVVIDALQEYKDWYKSKVQEDYAKADEIMDGKGGIELTEFANTLDRNSLWEGKASNQQLRRGIKSYLNELDLLKDDGSIKPMTAKQAEGLRQYINSQWSPDSASLIGIVNESVDMGVFSKLDDNAYLDARKRYRQYKETFENPKGIAKILDVDGINRKVSPEQVGRSLQQLAAKDGAQFNHIYGLLDNLPDEIKPKGKRAKAEIQAAIAETILGKGGLKSVNKEYMQYRRPNDDGSYKAADIFGDDVAKKLDTYIAGRNILQHQDPNPSGTATTARNIDDWNSPENIAAGTVGAIGGAMTGIGGIVGAGTAIAGKMAHQKIKGVMLERQSRADYNQSLSPDRAKTYRNANEQLVNRVISTDEMKMIIDEFEKPKPNETKIKVLQKKLVKTDAWKSYVKSLPVKARKAAMNNADVLTMITQGANQYEDNALKPTF
ncbi:hypothetical protein [Psychrobacter pygoscelis]|uniref:hypothetical protein n=1 Tax=Psychrobacter pygoscelis TaxID=2488563 RepID=UPI00103CDD55|nr:hypothetical protein [Psychrobacter pygoscelis]